VLSLTEILPSTLTTKPSVNGDAALPKRQGPKGFLPLSWTHRVVKVSYRDAFDNGVETSGTLLDIFPAGPVLNLNGCMALIAWERITLIELQPDR
jgi:hypothetical protein